MALRLRQCEESPCNVEQFGIEMLGDTVTAYITEAGRMTCIAQALRHPLSRSTSGVVDERPKVDRRQFCHVADIL
jgi:hypothetical protein